MKLYNIVEYDKKTYPSDRKKHLKQILLLYHDLEKFLMTFEDNKLKFLKDIRFLVERFQNMHTLTAPMFEYYGLRSQFDEYYDKTSSNDPDFEYLSEDIE